MNFKILFILKYKDISDYNKSINDFKSLNLNAVYFCENIM